MAADISADAHNVIIIGSGPAGLTAAIYAARANLKPLVIEAGQPFVPGGQLRETLQVENYPGFADGIWGNDLMDRMRKQAERFGTLFVLENADQVKIASSPFHIHTDGGRHFRGKTVIIATGSSLKPLGIPSEEALTGKGVSWSVTSDCIFFRNKDVVVVGGGDAALDGAILMSRMASNVTVIHRRDTLRASQIMQQRAFDNPKIEFAWNSIVDEILDPSASKVTGLTLRNVHTNEKRFLPTDGVFIAIGHTPNTRLFEGQLEMDPGGYILTLPGRPLTNVPGVFAAGDVQDTMYKQAVTAAGSGCMAAIEAERFLHGGGH